MNEGFMLDMNKLKHVVWLLLLENALSMWVMSSLLSIKRIF